MSGCFMMNISVTILKIITLTVLYHWPFSFPAPTICPWPPCHRRWPSAPQGAAHCGHQEGLCWDTGEAVKVCQWDAESGRGQFFSCVFISGFQLLSFDRSNVIYPCACRPVAWAGQVCPGPARNSPLPPWESWHHAGGGSRPWSCCMTWTSSGHWYDNGMHGQICKTF